MGTGLGGGRWEEQWPGQLHPDVQQTNAYAQWLADMRRAPNFSPHLLLGLTSDQGRGFLLGLGIASTYILLKMQIPQKEEHIQVH